MAVRTRPVGPDAAPRVGIVGAGQLARMLCEAASALGIATVVLAEHDDDAAAAVCGRLVLGSPRDPSALEALARTVDVVTFDHELVDLEAVRAIGAAGHTIRPGAVALWAAADKAHQRTRFAAAGLPVPAFTVLDARAEDDLATLAAFADAIGDVPVLKAARGGYDGRGVVVARSFAEAASALSSWRREGVAVVAEEPVAFRRELAALIARRPGGEAVSWRAVETTQVDGVCREVRVPGEVSDDCSAAATSLARRVAEHLGAVGILAVELFDSARGLLVNEVALRPHNTGHWTIEGSRTSQFENHLRAILDLPLGATDLVAPAVACVNVLGGQPGSAPRLVDALADPAAKVHLYGKEPRPGRKLGHVTVVGTDPDDVAVRAWDAALALGTPRPITVEVDR